MKKILLYTLLFQTSFLFSQSIVKNINNSGASAPSKGVEMNNIYYFAADDGVNGVELWKSDGTEVGTVLVKDINGGGDASPTHFTEVDGVLFFTADDGVHGRELWKTDGTSAGTVLVKDINPSGLSHIDELVAFQGLLFFVADDGVEGLELWTSSGDAGSTNVLIDINPGIANSSPHNLSVNDTHLWFSADDGTNGVELWWSDGSHGGTSLVDDLNVGAGNSSPSQFAFKSGYIYFSAHNGTNEYMWRSDGLTSSRVCGGFFTCNPITGFSHITEVGGEVIFYHNSSLKKIFNTDTTFTIIQALGAGINPSNFTPVEDNCFFTGSEGGNTDNVLWVINVSANNATALDTFPNTISHLTEVASVLFFRANDGTTGNELWMSNGTNSGTMMANEINASGDADPTSMVDVDGDLFFSADDGTNDAELWKYCIPCSRTLSPTVNSTGFYIGDNSSTDSDGWTNYCDLYGNLLLSIQLGSSGAIIPNNGVSILIGNNKIAYYEQYCGSGNNCFINNPDGAVMYNGTWDVLPTVQPNSEVAVRFYFPNIFHELNDTLDARGLTPINNYEDLRFYKAASGFHPNVATLGANDVTVLNHGSAASTTEWVYGIKRVFVDNYAEMKVTSFSGGGGGGASGGASFLPVDLINFQGKKVNEAIQLNWATASETNNRGFEVQKSTDGATWVPLEFINSKGNATTENFYQLMDKKPNIGNNYYRLNMIDFDGYSEFSNTVNVLFNSTDSDLQVSPNPARKSIVINTEQLLEKSSALDIEIFSATGQLVKKQVLNDTTVSEIDISQLTPGVYWIKVSNDWQQWSQKLVKF